MSRDVVLAARSVSRQYPGTLALDAVDFSVHHAAVNVLIGENGAGKSTLMRILAGEEQPTAGHLELDGRPVRFTSSRDAAAQGIAVIHQELNLLPNLSVADNVFLGRERTRYGVIDRREQERRTRELMLRLELDVDPGALVGDLPLGQRQIVEIAKASDQAARVLIMDEPTSALSAAEVQVLFRLIRDLRARGVAMVYISHRLEELLAIGDRITVLRDGRNVAEELAASATIGWMVEKMTGRASGFERGAETPPAGPAVLAVDGLRLRGPAQRPLLDDVSFTARAGEILGFYGVMGAGRTELFECLIGLRRPDAGSIALGGRPIEGLPVAERIRAGLALVPEDRQGAGIVPALSVRENITLSHLRALGSGWYVSPQAERRAAAELATELGIHAAALERPITSLSGGSQQKALVSRCLLTSPRVLLLDEPTRGVDVGARADLYAIVRRLAARGIAVLFASCELDEVLVLATRILVLSAGRITDDCAAAEATKERLVAASGGNLAHC